MDLVTSPLPARVQDPPRHRPVMIYDHDCRFCLRWITAWRRATAGRVDFLAAQQIGARWPELPRAVFDQSVVLIQTDGQLLTGPEAIFRIFDFAPNPPWLPRILRRIPGLMALARAVYRFVAAHRTAFSWIAPRS